MEFVLAWFDYIVLYEVYHKKSNNQQNNESSRIRVIFGKGIPNAHINTKNMHLECLSQNTE